MSDQKKPVTATTARVQLAPPPKKPVSALDMLETLKNLAQAYADQTDQKGVKEICKQAIYQLDEAGFRFRTIEAALRK